MADEHVEVLSQAINRPVLRMPGRAFPGILIQGDTLSSLYALARMAHDRAERHDDAELADLTGQMMDELADIIQEYEHVLVYHNRPLPYASPFPREGALGGGADERTSDRHIHDQTEAVAARTREDSTS
jgi:hypothetical protein